MERNINTEIENLSPEKKRELTNRSKARQIVKEILDFGVNEEQIREIIKQLALELEDREAMLKIYEFLGSPGEDVSEEVKVYT